jgi:hypothetical protein
MENMMQIPLIEYIIKTKFFLDNDCNSIQANVNAFLSKEDIKYVDIKFGMHNGQMICILIYKIAKPIPEKQQTTKD